MKRISTPLARLLDGQSVSVVVVQGLIGIGVLGAADYYTGSELSFSIFYLAPVLFVTWYAGRILGMGYAILSALTWMAMDLASGARYSHAAIPVWNMIVRLGFFNITLYLLDSVKRAHALEQKLSRTDSLTGIANGRQFFERAAVEIARSRRSGLPITLAYVDLDNFKKVNDSLGHSVGDELLRTIALELSGRLRATDLVARLGGDEYGILLPETDYDQAQVVLAKARDGVSSAIGEGGGSVTQTVGAVTFTVVPDSVDEMLHAADTVMYEGKRAGRDRIVHVSQPA
ncbi:MAG: GGDEF domain-containing protein [Actinomycetota bacterium]|nr:GGDEF domain-containing protein [Actinomycetota bacterium]